MMIATVMATQQVSIPFQLAALVTMVYRPIIQRSAPPHWQLPSTGHLIEKEKRTKW